MYMFPHPLRTPFKGYLIEGYFVNLKFAERSFMECANRVSVLRGVLPIHKARLH